MEPAETLALERRARRAYERGRLGRAFLLTAWLLPVLAAMIGSCRVLALSGVSGSLLMLAAVGLWWRGQAYGRAVGPGVGAGLVPLGATISTAALGHLGPALTCWQVCLTICVTAGALAGLVVGHRAAQQGSDRRSFLVSAGVIAVLVGAPGCAFAGAAGIIGMSLGLAAVSTPLALRSSLPAR
ncbi:MAG TPA: hypothetical protein VN461_12420 [Vicinamibacteria bacterium]|jgi:hypothetical protein|nr:hypothetical protein [Vicinamibacteria bacterium]